MIDTKPWYMSKSIISSAVSLFALIAFYLGFDLSDPKIKESIVNDLMVLLPVIANIIAIYGRVTAKKKIGSGKKNGQQV